MSSSLQPQLQLRPSSHSSPAKRLKVSVGASSLGVLMASESSPRSRAEEEALADAFSSSCRCGAAGSAPTRPGASAPLHVHLDVASIHAALARSMLPLSLPLPLAASQRLLSAPVAGADSSLSLGASGSAVRCQCIQLPPPRTGASASSSHKRRHVSPPLTPVSLSSHQLHALSLRANMAEAATATTDAYTDTGATRAPSSSPPPPSTTLTGVDRTGAPQFAVDSGRTIVRVVKRHPRASAHRWAGHGATPPVSVPSSPRSSRTAAIALDEERDGSDVDADVDAPLNACSESDSDSDSDSDPSSPRSFASSTLGLLASPPGASALSHRSSAAATPPALDQLASSSSNAPAHEEPKPAIAAPTPPAHVGDDNQHPLDDESDCVDSSCLLEIMQIEQEEAESELNFLMQTMNQQGGMPYIL